MGMGYGVVWLHPTFVTDGELSCLVTPNFRYARVKPFLERMRFQNLDL